MTSSDAKRKTFLELNSINLRTRYPKCALKRVEGTHLALMDSNIGGCASWCKAVIEGRREQVPDEHQRYLRDTLLFLERIAPAETEPACIEQFSLWIRLVRSMLDLIDAESSTDEIPVSRDELL